MLALINGEVVITVRPPLVYLDHWALRRLSEDAYEAEREHFLETFKTRGTLMFSIMNAYELAASNTGPSYERIRNFLNAVGPHWLFSDIDPDSADRAVQSGVPPPLCFLVPKQLFAALLTQSPDWSSGNFPLGTSLELVHTPEFRNAAKERIDKFDSLVSLMSKNRNNYLSGRKLAQLERPKTGPTASWIQLSFLQSLLKQKKVLTTNDVVDLLHASMSLTFAHVAMLDGFWASEASKLKLEYTYVFDQARLAEGVEKIRTLDMSNFRMLSGL